MASTFTSWGGGEWRPADSQRPINAAELKLNDKGWLAYGNGRSYGDSCFNSSGTQIDMRGMSRLIGFDETLGILECQPGLILGDLINLMVPKGWFPAVVPGTRYVTIGGAIANDIHGKNHHSEGSFGEHVLSFELLRPDTGLIICSRDQNAELFHATIGGMGLTGVIVSARLQLKRVSSTKIVQTVTPLETLRDFFQLAPQAERNHEYCVAWIDSLAKGKELGRGVLIAGDHAANETDALQPPLAPARMSIPFTPPLSPINRWSLTAFNALYRRATLRHTTPQTVNCGAFFFPLDAVSHWNRLYGPRGLRQHQSVLPFEHAETIVRRMLEATHNARQGSFLTVLKLFQKRAPVGMMSFPMEGVTLTLDFPHRGQSTDALLDELDQLTLEAGGRVNPYKDAHMSAATFAASFPHAAAFRPLLAPGAQSQFSQRVGLT